MTKTIVGAVVVSVLGLGGAALRAQDGQWPMYSGAYNSHRFSPLTQIDTGNVARLRPLWVYQPPGTGSVECTPIVVNGVMYVTSGPTSVSALDLKSGAQHQPEQAIEVLHVPIAAEREATLPEAERLEEDPIVEGLGALQGTHREVEVIDPDDLGGHVSPPTI